MAKRNDKARRGGIPLKWPLLACAALSGLIWTGANLFKLLASDPDPPLQWHTLTATAPIEGGMPTPLAGPRREGGALRHRTREEPPPVQDPAVRSVWDEAPGAGSAGWTARAPHPSQPTPLPSLSRAGGEAPGQGLSVRPPSWVGNTWPPVSAPADWTLKAPSTCEGYFGNGWDSQLTFWGPDAAPKASGGGQAGADNAPFVCHRNPAHPSAFCVLRNVAVYPSRVAVSRGNESLAEVMGRSDPEEMPQYMPGAMEVEVNAETPSGTGVPAHTRPHLDAILGPNGDLARQLRSTHSRSCARTVQEPTLLITRVEYANLFHASTEQYAVYAVARALGAPGPMPLVLADGHCRNPVDEAWEGLTSKLDFVKQLLPEGDPGAVCFRELILVPNGYHAAISTGIQPLAECRASGHVREFGEHYGALMGVSPPPGKACSGKHLRVLFVRRENYLAHPRQKSTIVQRIENEEDILTALQGMAKEFEAHHAGYTVTVVSGTFSRMSLSTQVKHAQEACVMLGAHGAGLSHLLFMRPEGRVLEVQTPHFHRPHFRAYAHWAGSKYEALSSDSNRPNPSLITSKVRGMLESVVFEAETGVS